MSGVNYSIGSISKSELLLVENYLRTLTQSQSYSPVNLTNTSGILELPGAVLDPVQTTTANTHLKIKVGATFYKIELKQG